MNRQSRTHLLFLVVTTIALCFVICCSAPHGSENKLQRESNSYAVSDEFTQEMDLDEFRRLRQIGIGLVHESLLEGVSYNVYYHIEPKNIVRLVFSPRGPIFDGRITVRVDRETGELIK